MNLYREKRLLLEKINYQIHEKAENRFGNNSLKILDHGIALKGSNNSEEIP
jgi:hypothetical protein